eukprot:COSAG01_NODE_42205_length_442_cov_1.236152_1_plen_72_part_10
MKSFIINTQQAHTHTATAQQAHTHTQTHSRQGGISSQHAPPRTPLIKWQSSDGPHSLNPPMHPKQQLRPPAT